MADARGVSVESADMVRLSEWMRAAGLSDEDVAAAAGVSAETIRKLRFGVRGASVRVAARIDALSGGQVRPSALVATKPRSRRAAPVEGACP